MAYVTAERVGNELQQLLIVTDQLYMGNDMLTDDKVQIGPNTVLDDSNDCFDNNDDDDDETSDYFVSKVEVIETSTLRTNDEDHGSDSAEKDLEDVFENVVNNSKTKRIYECDSCKETFNLWKELRVRIVFCTRRLNRKEK